MAKRSSLKRIRSGVDAFLRKAAFSGFPRVINAVGEGHKSVGAIAKHTGMPKGVVAPLVKFAQGIWVEKTKGGLVITAEGRDLVRARYTAILRRLDNKPLNREKQIISSRSFRITPKRPRIS